MNKEEAEIVLGIIFGIIVLVVWIIYASKPELHNCGMCGNEFKSIKQQRFWYEIDGEKRPVCSKCNRKWENRRD